MGSTNLKHSLTKRYSNLSGQVLKLRRTIDEAERLHSTLPELRAKLAENEDTLKHIAALMRDIDPTWDEKRILPVIRHAYTLPLPYGECTVRAYEILRKANRWITIREVVTKMIDDADIEVDTVLYQKLEANIIAGFNRRLKRGEVQRIAESSPHKWRITPLKQMAKVT